MEKTYRIGDQNYSTPYEDLFRPLTAEEYAGLRESIRQEGILVPVIINDGHMVIDGAHRVAIAEELGITTLNFTVFAGRSKEEERALAIDLNRHRRHLTPEDRQALALGMRKQGKSYRQIGEALGVDGSTAYHDVLEATVGFPTLEMPGRVVGKDGRSRPARVPADERQPEPPEMSAESVQREPEPPASGLSNEELFKLIYQLVGKTIRAVDDLGRGCNATQQEYQGCLDVLEELKRRIVAWQAAEKKAERQE